MYKHCFQSAKKYFKNLLISSSLTLLLFGCKTTSSIKSDSETTTAPVIESNLTFEDVTPPYKYIFIRLYNPIYKNPFYIANLLKGGIKITQIDDIEVSHASINFSLDDEFYGLALRKGKQLAKESCTDSEADEYMEKCRADESEQITYAIRVSEEEFNNTKKFIEEYAELDEITYDTFINFKMAAFSIKRKFLTAKAKRQFGNIEYKKTKDEDRKEFDPHYVVNNFVCSTFIAYALNKNIASVNQWFNEHLVNYRYVNVGDLPNIPGVQKLFFSTWEDYLDTAETFVENNPEFKQYLKN